MKRPNDVERHERWTSTSDRPCFPIRTFSIDDGSTNHDVCDMPRDPTHPCLGIASSDARTRDAHRPPRRTSDVPIQNHHHHREPQVHGEGARRRHTCEVTLPSSRTLPWHWRDAKPNVVPKKQSKARRRPTSRTPDVVQPHVRVEHHVEVRGCIDDERNMDDRTNTHAEDHEHGNRNEGGEGATSVPTPPRGKEKQETNELRGDVMLRFLPMRLGKPDFAVAMDPCEPNPETWKRCSSHHTHGTVQPNASIPYTMHAPARHIEQEDSHDSHKRSDLFRNDPTRLSPLKLPQQFGNAHVGTTFHAYVCLVNGGNGSATQLNVHAEMRCDGKKTVLFQAGPDIQDEKDRQAPDQELPYDKQRDSPTQHRDQRPVERDLVTLQELGPGERFDFCVDYPMQTAGPHSLVCSCTYTDAQGARRVLPQHFKFEVEYPLRITTNVRDVCEKASSADSNAGRITYVEAALENLTDTPLLLRHVRFEPRPHLSCRLVGVDDEEKCSGICSSFLEHMSESEESRFSKDKRDRSTGSHATWEPSLERDRSSVVHGALSAAKARAMDRLSRVARKLDLMAPAGGTRHFVFALEERRDNAGAGRGDVAEPDRLGRLRVEWRMPMGEKGELRTQQVMATQSASASVELAVHYIPSPTSLEMPFRATFKLRNLTEATMGPLAIQIEATGPKASFLVCGKRGIELESLAPLEERAVEFTMVPCKSGVQPLPAVCALDMHTRSILCSLPRYDMYVDGNMSIT